MQILCDSHSIQEAVQSTNDPELTRLMTAHMERLSDYEDFDLGQLVNFIVMGRGDTVFELEAALGFSVMTNRSNCSGKLISPVLAGSFQVLYTYVMKLFFGLYDGFTWKSIRRDADSGNIW